MTTAVVSESKLDLPLIHRGKVRDTHTLADGTLLMVASDRVSAFDVVLPSLIPDKGRVLTQMSRYWFGKTGSIIENHLLEHDLDMLPNVARNPEWLDRSMRVKKAQRIDIECVVRGYLSGSGWKEYQENQTLAGELLAPGLLEASRLPEPRFTPALKNDSGHDENISRVGLADHVGSALAQELERVSIALYEYGRDTCLEAGIVLADTKFEFGTVDDKLILIDEVLTPDSSRFWEQGTWKPGTNPPSFDKQFVRDYLNTLTWDKTPPGPELPDYVINATQKRYLEADRRICGGSA